MDINSLPLPEPFKKRYAAFNTLTPIQEKAVKAGLLEKKSILVCAPTASGKTLIATMAIYNTLGNHDTQDNTQDNSLEQERKKSKSIYLVPLKALGTEKYKEYLTLFKDSPYKVILSTGDVDSEADYLTDYDLLILTTEKLDSLLRHRVGWLSEVKTVIVDEIHLLNDTSRGPTLEIILTLLKSLIKPQIIGLSATIGNPKELSEWLGATLIIDEWRPVELKKGIYAEKEVEYY
ncbi:MAG: DEAD/DEAH box helicase [Nanoarchaeota archaeon]